jgi:NAD(P)-dependent dehydrogenase (short-subunit alcohol dehydrogenase family)
MTQATDSMNGKTCLVTGASGGIGFETARALAHQGAHVILVGHNWQRGEAALERIRREHEAASIEFMLADLSVLAHRGSPTLKKTWLPAPRPNER